MIKSDITEDSVIKITVNSRVKIVATPTVCDPMLTHGNGDPTYDVFLEIDTMPFFMTRISSIGETHQRLDEYVTSLSKALNWKDESDRVRCSDGLLCPKECENECWRKTQPDYGYVWPWQKCTGESGGYRCDYGCFPMYCHKFQHKDGAYRLLYYVVVVEDTTCIHRHPTVADAVKCGEKNTMGKYNVTTQHGIKQTLTSWNRS